VAGTGAGTTALRAGVALLVPTTREDSHERYPIHPAASTAAPIKIGNSHCQRTRDSQRVMKSRGPFRRPVSGGGAE
jgi:hypothetical protein